MKGYSVPVSLVPQMGQEKNGDFETILCFPSTWEKIDSPFHTHAILTPSSPI